MNDTTVVVTSQDMTKAVRESALLADVTISVWGAERTDPKAMDEVKLTHNAVGNVGRVIKNMLAGADGRLKDVKGAFNAVRQAHYQITLPWVSDPHALRQTGPRLLPHLLFDRYLLEMGKRKRAATDLLDTFIAEYPGLVQQARGNLGTLADATYPDELEVRAAFRISTDFLPIPSGDQFGHLPGHLLERLSKGLHAKQERMIASAQSAMWQAVRERVEHLTGRLSDAEAKFKSSTVEGLRDLLVLLPGWDITGDARVAEVVGDISQMLDGVNAETLRDNVNTRASVAAQGAAVMEKLSQWGI